MNNSSGTPVHPAKPSPAPVGRNLREEKKAPVIVAHRRLQNESGREERQASFNEFNRSLLDEAPNAPIVGKRYSDEELAEFRDIINSRLENARKELAYLQGLIMRKDGEGTEDSENRFNAEDGSGAMERETVYSAGQPPDSVYHQPGKSADPYRKQNLWCLSRNG
ncbi:MAG: hypothetical protein QM743_12925 [Chitinophagaceae bacterium]